MTFPRTGLMLAWAFLASWMPALAQDASVEVTVNATNVSQGDLIRVTLTFVNCKVKELDPPQIQGLDWRMGPSTSSNTQWINGVTTSKQQYTYGYAVTTAKEVRIPAMTWKTNRGALKSNPVRIVVESGTSQNTPSRTKTKVVQRDLVTAIEPSKRTVYLGEPLVLTYKIYNRYTNLDVRNYDIPELEGFWKETVQTPDARWEPQLINGKRYNVATVRQIVAFPQQTGTFTLRDFDLTGYLRINFFEGRDVQATCDPVTIEVLPLPEAAPRNSVGTFSSLNVT
ncbi:MAG: BatD family protein, partial [Bacteroidota bacterium]|nr:BatD family protein [Bacteroidota bacterium]